MKRRRTPSPLRRSSTSWIRKSTRFAIYARDGFDCFFCRGLFPLAEDGHQLTLDHIVPRSAGGTDDPTNLITTCHDCNSLRQHAELPAARRKKAETQAQRPLNRALGLLYARLYLACRGQQHPLTLRIVPSATVEQVFRSLFDQ